MPNLLTYSKFYYGYIVDENNQYIDFDDGSGIRQAKIPAGAYTLYTLGVEISRQMTSVSPLLTFSCIADRDTRKYTISSLGENFTLLFDTGVNAALSIFNLIGFEDLDYDGSNSYSGTYETGSAYYPQYMLGNFVHADFTKYPVASVVNKSTSGNSYEVVRFGSNRLYRFEILFTTNVDTAEGPIKSNPSGVEDLNSFMDYCTNKYPIEIMLDENDSNSFDTIMLETTPQSQDGVSYELYPMYNEKIPDFYTLGGQLIFRRIE